MRKKTTPGEYFGVPSGKVNRGDKVVSVTQLAMYSECPKKWELQYILGHRREDMNVFLFMGNVIHATLQRWHIDGISNEKIISVYDTIFDTTLDEYLTQYGGGVLFCEGEVLATHREAGYTYVRTYCNETNRADINEIYDELQIYRTVSPGLPTVKMVAYLDIAARSGDKFIIRDFKVSTRGWGKYHLSDEMKVGQLLLYKQMFSDHFNISMKNIAVEYVIFSLETPGVIQYFSPQQTPLKCAKMLDKISIFAAEVFNADGTYNTDKKYPAVRGMNSSNCKFCPFKDDYKKCKISKRVLALS